MKYINTMNCTVRKKLRISKMSRNLKDLEIILENVKSLHKFITSGAR